MNIELVRIANIVFVVLVIFNNQQPLLWYLGAMHLSLEVLNRKQEYLAGQYKRYNLICWLYSLVLLERLRHWHLTEQFEWAINCTEHLLFGIIICIKVYIYTAIFSKASKATRWKRAIIAFALFNIIGLFNEVFQNSLGNRSLFVFIPDSIKDIKMNLLGAAFFIMAVLCRIRWLKRTA